MEALVALAGVALGAGIAAAVAWTQGRAQREHEVRRDLFAARRAAYADVLAASAALQSASRRAAGRAVDDSTDSEVARAMAELSDTYHRARLLAGPSLTKRLRKLRKGAALLARVDRTDLAALSVADETHQRARREARQAMLAELGIPGDD